MLLHRLTSIRCACLATVLRSPQRCATYCTWGGPSRITIRRCTAYITVNGPWPRNGGKGLATTGTSFRVLDLSSTYGMLANAIQFNRILKS
jgi:hypothetical protein